MSGRLYLKPGSMTSACGARPLRVALERVGAETVEAQPPQPRRELVVVRADEPAFAGREVLDRMEREDRRAAAPPACRRVLRAGRVRRVFDERNARAAASARSGRRSSDAPAKCTGTISFVRGVSAAATRSAVVISVSRSTSTNTGVAPASAIRFDGRHPGHRRRHDLVAGPYPERAQQQVHAGRGRRQRDRVPGADRGGERLLELGAFRAGRDPARCEHLRDRRDVLRA